MQLTRDGVVIYGAGINPDVSQQLHYALGTNKTKLLSSFHSSIFLD